MRAVLCTVLLALALCLSTGHVRLADAVGEVIDATEIAGEFGGWGYDVAVISDLDGDGKNEVAVSASSDDTDGTNTGALWILFLHADNNTVRERVRISNSTGGLAEAGIILSTNDEFGYGVTLLSDMDGDGIPEIAVGQPGSNAGGTAHGASMVLFLHANGTVRDATLIDETTGGLAEAGVVLGDNEFWGLSVGTLTDIDGDGYDELVVGGAGNTNDIYVLFLHANNATVRSVTVINGSSTGLSGFATADSFGQNSASIVSIGDLDGDGIDELAVGALGDDDNASAAGAVYILFLNEGNATVRNATKISASVGGLSEAGVTLVASNGLGQSLASLPDLDGDGVRELAVGTTKEQVFILFLNNETGTVHDAYEINNAAIDTIALEASDRLGQGLAVMPGTNELVAGLYGRDVVNASRGAILILELNSTVGSTTGTTGTTGTTTGATGAVSGDDYRPADDDAITWVSISMFGAVAMVVAAVVLYMARRASANGAGNWTELKR